MKSNAHPKLLIVDDEPGMLRTLRRIMAVKGFEVETADSGPAAIERAAAWQPDCVLMDIRMPGMNGIEAFQRIKETSPGALVLFMTAYSGSSIVEEALAEGGLGVVAKPLDIDALCEQLAEAARERPVLVVDDDRAFCESLARVLKAKGYEVHSVQTSEDAIEAFRRRPRGIVLLDMKLNGDTGLDVLERLRKINPRTIAVLMTGFADMEPQMQQLLQHDACACFTKPIDLDRLLETIGQVA